MTCCNKQKETVGGPTAGLLLAERLLPVRLIQRRRQGKYNLNDVRPACHVAAYRKRPFHVDTCSDHPAISRARRTFGPGSVQLAKRANVLSLASSAEVKNAKMLTASGQSSACCTATEQLTLKTRTGAYEELVHERR